MGEKSVIVVISNYNDSDSNLQIVGVYHNMDSFEEHMRNYLENYAEEHYASEEDIIEACDMTLKEYIDKIMHDLKRNDEAVDPMDCSQMWEIAEKTIKHKNYAEAIKKMIPEGCELIIKDIRFFPYNFGGNDTESLAQAVSLSVNDSDDILIKDADGDYWQFNDQPVWKQEELYRKLNR